MDFDAVVLAGGDAARLGGVDKPALRVGETTLLDRALDAVADADRRVVVGPRRATRTPAIWCREDPPGGGPLAGLAAGLPLTRAALLIVLAADLPWIAPAVPVLLAALTTSPADCAALVDASGHRNLLAAAWRRPALARAVAALQPVAGKPIRALAGHAVLVVVGDEAGWGADCDTWDDVAATRRRLREEPVMTNPLDSWVHELAAELGVDPHAVDTRLLLDVARDAAHGVSRPAAPLTTFLVGLAAGAHGGSAQAVADAAATAQRLAVAHADSAGHDGG